MNAQTLQGSRRVVLTYPNRPREPQHGLSTPRWPNAAVLLGLSYGGEYDPTRRYDAHPYTVPSGTVVGLHEAHELGLNEEGDLFGGVVPQPFVETKAITHPLVRPDAVAPVGWSRDFGTQSKAACWPATARSARRMPGTRGDSCCMRAVRIKPVRATGGAASCALTTAMPSTGVVRPRREAGSVRRCARSSGARHHLQRWSGTCRRASGQLLR